MLDQTKITIRRLNSIGVAYGEPVSLAEAREHLKAEVADEVEDAVIETDEDSGEVTVGGQRYGWER